MQPWCTASILFQEANFSPINEGSCWNLPLQELISLTIWISDCLSLAHIVEIRMDSLSVLFQDGSSSSNFSRKVFEFCAYTNILDNWIAAMVHWQYFVGTCSCANSLDHLDFMLYIVGSHSRNKYEFSVSLFRDRSSSSNFLRKLFEF